MDMGEAETVEGEGHEFLGVEWEVEVRDARGNITDHKTGKNSMLLQTASALCLMIDYTTGVSVAMNGKTTAGAAQYIAHGNSGNFSGLDVVGAAGDVLHGIIVGTNNTGVTADDYKINTIVANGVGAGQLQYLVTTLNVVVNASPRSNLRIDRTFTNGSGGGITVKELALYVYNNTSSFCLIRDVIADTPVANGSSLFVKYTLYITI